MCTNYCLDKVANKPHKQPFLTFDRQTQKGGGDCPAYAKWEMGTSVLHWWL